jgi:hypothetical protein
VTSDIAAYQPLSKLRWLVASTSWVDIQNDAGTTADWNGRVNQTVAIESTS